MAASLNPLRWAAALMLWIGGSTGIPMIYTVLAERSPAFETATDFRFMIMAAWAIAIAGIHLLPLRAKLRGVVAVLTTPLLVYLALWTYFSAACAWYHHCAQ